MDSAAARERTYIMIKPDGVQRGLVGQIISRFETKGFKLVAMKICMPGKEMFEKHYADLSKKGFFAGLVEYAASGPVCCMVWRDQTPSLPEERCSVPPSHSTLSQVPSEVTTALMSAEISATDLTQLSQPTMRSLFGSSQRSLFHGPITPINGFMSDSFGNRILKPQ